MRQASLHESPETLQYALSQIPSNQMRDSLTRVLADIDTLLATIDPSSLDPKLKETCDNFMHYISDSCVSVNTMRRRCSWMLSFANIVRDKLRIHSYARLPNNHIDFLNITEEMHQALDDMIVEIAAFETQNHSDMLVNTTDIVAVVHQIAQAMSTPPPTTLPATIQDAVKEIRFITKYIRDFTEIRTMIRIGDASVVLHQRLQRLQKKLTYMGRPRASIG